MTNQPTARQLWSMKPDVFNAWRAKNDIPVLFEFLKNLLPGFQEWLSSLPFDELAATQIVPTGALFKDEAAKTLIQRPSEYSDAMVLECRVGREADVRRELGDLPAGWKSLGEFMPYLAWAKKTLGRKRFFAWPTEGGMRGGTFEYARWRGDADSEEVTTAAYLFQTFNVLKLGQVKVPDLSDVGARNLDFADLDYLVIDGTFQGSRWKTISYSSCRGIRFNNAKTWFHTFHQCAIDDIHFDACQIYGLHFEKIERGNLHIADSDIRGLRLTESHMKLYISNCDLRDIDYEPSRNVLPHDVASIYRQLRAAYQSRGLRREAADAYYNERTYERKSLFQPYAEYEGQFPGIGYAAHFRWPFIAYRLGRLDRATLVSQLFGVLKVRLRVLRSRLFFRLIKFRMRWLASLFESVIWGYGERPSRIFLWALAMICAYTVTYHALPWPAEPGKGTPAGWFDDAYFSVVTFTTLGYGDILPTSKVLKAVCASEALIGAFSLGLIVAGFSNRTKY